MELLSPVKRSLALGEIKYEPLSGLDRGWNASQSVPPLMQGELTQNVAVRSQRFKPTSQLLSQRDCGHSATDIRLYRLDDG